MLVSKNGGRNQITQKGPIKIKDVIENEQETRSLCWLYVISAQELLSALDTFIEFRTKTLRQYNSDSKSKG